MNISGKNIAITFGGYCPLHQGHLDVIMKAKKENDYCVVVVCGYDNEPRAAEIGVDLDTRFNLITEFFKNDEQIITVKINDTVLGIDESMSDHNWDVWLDAVAKKMTDAGIELFENDYTFYVSELSYKSAIDKRTPYHNTKCVYVGRDVNPVSGTAIRKNPIKFWNKIAKPFRKYMTKNILITGTASEGKTTLVQDISRYFGIPCTEEFGREYMADKKLTDTQLSQFDFMEFIKGQNNAILKAQEQSNTGVVISDTDNLVTLMYASAYAVDSDCQLSLSDYELWVKPYADMTKDVVKWDKIFFLTPNGEFVDDGTRYMKQSTIEERQMNKDRLVKFIEEYGLSDKVEYLTGGDFYHNFEVVRDYINSLYNE